MSSLDGSSDLVSFQNEMSGIAADIINKYIVQKQITQSSSKRQTLEAETNSNCKKCIDVMYPQNYKFETFQVNADSLCVRTSCKKKADGTYDKACYKEEDGFFRYIGNNCDMQKYDDLMVFYGGCGYLPGDTYTQDTSKYNKLRGRRFKSNACCKALRAKQHTTNDFLDYKCAGICKRMCSTNLNIDMQQNVIVDQKASVDAELDKSSAQSIANQIKKAWADMSSELLKNKDALDKSTTNLDKWVATVYKKSIVAMTQTSSFNQNVTIKGSVQMSGILSLKQSGNIIMNSVQTTSMNANSPFTNATSEIINKYTAQIDNKVSKLVSTTISDYLTGLKPFLWGTGITAAVLIICIIILTFISLFHTKT